MTKLKSLLEGFAWERKDGKPLPTLAEVQAEYEAKQKTELESSVDESAAYDDASENELASYISKLSAELSNETNPAKIKLITQDIADVKQTLEDKKGNSPRWQDNNRNGKWYEPEDVSEESNPIKAKIAKLEKELADVKHQYYKDSNLSPEREDQLRKKMGDLGRELKRAKREDKTGSVGYGNPSKSIDPKPDYIDADGDGDETESMKKAFQDKKEMHESFISRIKKNLIGGVTRK